MDHFLNPRNAGVIENADAVGETDTSVCGDIVKIYLSIDNDIITNAKFETFGCGMAIASSSAITELIIGKTICEVSAFREGILLEVFKEIPDNKLGCSLLAEKAVQNALKNYCGEKNDN